MIIQFCRAITRNPRSMTDRALPPYTPLSRPRTDPAVVADRALACLAATEPPARSLRSSMSAPQPLGIVAARPQDPGHRQNHQEHHVHDRQPPRLNRAVGGLAGELRAVPDRRDPPDPVKVG